MIKLYGFKISNYQAMIKAFLLEKGVAFEEIEVTPTETQSLLDKSPMGKVPFIELKEGFLSESTVILGFLENCTADEPMVPADPFRAAQMAQVVNVLELYIGTEAARLNGYVFFGREFNQAAADDIKPMMERGLAALNRLGSFSPFVMGDDITIADFFAYYILGNTRIIAKKVWRWDILADVDGLGEWMTMMSQRPFIKLVDDERAVAISKM